MRFTVLFSPLKTPIHGHLLVEKVAEAMADQTQSAQQQAMQSVAPVLQDALVVDYGATILL